MTVTASMRSILVVTALERATSPMMRKSVFELPGFRSEYALQAEIVTAFPGSGAKFRRQILLDAVRRALSTETEQSVPDERGNEWALGPSTLNYGFPTLDLSRSGARIPLTEVASLSANRSVRLRFLKQLAADLLLPREASTRWRRILYRRPLNDAEVDELYADFLDTPRRMSHLVRRQARGGNLPLSSLVPQSKRYFERLIGIYDGSNTISEYAQGGARRLLEGLRKRRVSRDQRSALLWQALLLSVHPSITETICELEFPSEDIKDVVEQLGVKDDPFSCTGAIEIGLSTRQPAPSLQRGIAELVHAILGNAGEPPADSSELFAACLILVDGQLVRSGLLAGGPPFYRRLAAACHASVLTRALLEAGIDTRGFCEFARAQGGAAFYFGAIADMRLEPGWAPALALVPQIRQHISSRIAVALGRHAGEHYGSELRELVQENAEDQERQESNMLGWLFRTPLDGVCDASRPISESLTEQITADLASVPVTEAQFHGLIVTARVFDVGEQHAEAAASALSRLEHSGGTQEPGSLFSALVGLGSVAAVARSAVLADALRDATRRFGPDGQRILSVRERETVLLSAAASHHNLDDWVGWVGEVMTELAFGTVDRAEATDLLSHLRLLCRLVPDLWLTCGRADAALKAVSEG